MTDKPFGHSCIVTYRRYGCSELCEREIHRRGPKSRVESAARMMSGYRSHRHVEAYTREQWVRVFGVGSETGRYYIGE